MDVQTLKQWAIEEIEATWADLPPELRDRARAVPVTFQRAPNKLQLEDGIEHDTLGLFVGPPHAEQESTAFPIPPQIILFLENIWDFSDKDPEVFREEVHTTVVHELGHYLGFDEDDLVDRGLE